MNRYFYTITLCCLLIGSVAFAQKQAICGFDELHKELLVTDINYREQVEASRQLWAEYQNNKAHTQERVVVTGSDTVIEIPVVIHVIHTGGAIGTNYNPSDADLLDWIDYLNEVYAGTYPPYAGSGSPSMPVVFVPAQRDPNCNPTNGIVRVNGTSLPNYAAEGMASSGSPIGVSMADVKALSAWPQGSYYNIYVVNRINGEDGFTTTGAYVAGFALLGTGIPSSLDGAYMLAYTAEAGNITLPHELGHAFGLYHTFEGGSAGCPANADCTQDGDEVCDTEPGQSLLGVPCPASSAINPCTSLPYGVNGVQYNFMNYTSCVANHFTQGQADRMQFMLTTYRSELVHSQAVLPPPTQTIPQPIAATCVPPGITNNLNANIGPTTVQLDSIMSPSLGYYPGAGSVEYYIDFTTECGAFHTSLVAGDTAQLTVITQFNNQAISAYIDYNNNGSFTDANEQIMNQSVSAPETYSVSFIPPTTAVQNTPLRLRVIADLNSTITPCGTLAYGQAEDYSVTILPETPLPTSPLLSFQGEVAGFLATLSWTVRPTTSISGFELERSLDGRNFEQIKDVTYEGASVYAFDDQMLEIRPHYYRLKTINSNGSYLFSKVILLNPDASAKSVVSVYPNPTNDLLNIRSNGYIKEVRLMSATGQLLKVIKPAGLQATISMKGLAAGIYLVRAIASEGSVSQVKVIKE